MERAMDANPRRGPEICDAWRSSLAASALLKDCCSGDGGWCDIAHMQAMVRCCLFRLWRRLRGWSISLQAKGCMHALNVEASCCAADVACHSCSKQKRLLVVGGSVGSRYADPACVPGLRYCGAPRGLQRHLLESARRTRASRGREVVSDPEPSDRLLRGDACFCCEIVDGMLVIKPNFLLEPGICGNCQKTEAIPKRSLNYLNEDLRARRRFWSS
jgi:hypothetical protein